MWKEIKDVQLETEIEEIGGELLNIHKVTSSRGEKNFVYSSDYKELISVFPRMDSEIRKELIQMVVQDGIRFKLRYH